MDIFNTLAFITKPDHVELPAGDIISTQFYTKELAKLFPKESIYEDSVLR